MLDNENIGIYVLDNQVTQGDTGNGEETMPNNVNISMYVLRNQLTQGDSR